MKKQIRYFLALLLLPLCSCAGIDDSEPLPGVTNYSVCLYGCGGGDLDVFFVDNLREALKVGPSTKVTMMCQFNFSKTAQEMYENLRGTKRIVLRKRFTGFKVEQPASYEKKDTLDQYRYVSEVIGQAVEAEAISVTDADKDSAVLPLYLPSTLTSYLDWAWKTQISQNYILVLWDHGSPWEAQTEKTKSVLSDNNFLSGGAPLSMSAKETVEGIVGSRTAPYMKCIYVDTCQMSSIENMAEYASASSYALASCCIVPKVGGDYTSLLKILNSTKVEDDDFVKAMAEYSSRLVKDWDADGGIYTDIELWNLGKLDDVTGAIRKLVPLLEKYYPEKTAEYDALARDVYIHSAEVAEDGALLYNVMSLGHYASLLALYAPNSEVKGAAKKVFDTLDSVLNVEYASGVDPDYCIGAGVTFLTKTQYESQEKKYVNTYSHSEYCSDTDWGDWLKTNGQALGKNNPSYF